MFKISNYFFLSSNHQFKYFIFSMARSYRTSFIETYGGVPNMYAQKIFCSWDFGISNEKAAELKHNSIYIDLKEVLSDLQKAPADKTMVQEFWTFCTQITAHVLVFSMLAGLGVGMWSLLQVFSWVLLRCNAIIQSISCF